MVRAALILLGFALVISVSAFAVMRMPANEEAPPPAPVATQARPEPPVVQPPPRQERLAVAPLHSPEVKILRQIAPDTIVAPTASNVALTREEPRPPLGDLGLARDKLPEDQAPQKGPLLRRPIATSAGEIEVAGYSIKLAGIVPTPPDKTCPEASGTETPCGMRARTAFRQFLRGRAIRCDVPDKPTGEAVVTTCALARTDLGKWLVENGWALPDGDRYGTVAEKAREKRRGLLANATR